MAADIQYATHLQMSQGYQLLNQLPAACLASVVDVAAGAVWFFAGLIRA